MLQRGFIFLYVTAEYTSPSCTYTHHRERAEDVHRVRDAVSV